MSDDNMFNDAEMVHQYIFDMVLQLANLAERVDDEDLAARLKQLLPNGSPSA